MERIKVIATTLMFILIIVSVIAINIWVYSIKRRIGWICLIIAGIIAAGLLVFVLVLIIVNKIKMLFGKYTNK